MSCILIPLLLFLFGVVSGETPISSSPPNTSSVSALFILGDSSVNCGNNDFFYNVLHERSSLYPCIGLETRLLPDMLGEKMGLPVIPPFYSQNGSIEGLLNGLNYGSSQATIMNTGILGFQTLNFQLRQLFETLQMYQLQLGENNARKLIQSSAFYISLGKDDYIQLFLHDFSGIKHKYGGGDFAHILVKQITQVIKELYNANARKIICMGIGPLGCAPGALWESYNSSARTNTTNGKHCAQEINQLILQYNGMLSKRLLDLNSELSGAQIIFCDVYQGVMEIITNPKNYGFSDVRQACCGLGRYGGMIGCVTKEMACNNSANHVWWDFYNPTHGVNALLANWTWSGQPFHLCHPIQIQQFVSSPSAAKHVNQSHNAS